MLKSGPNYFRNIFYGKSIRKVRTDSFWTDSYPSPEPSLLKKISNTTGDWIYNHIDNFFQGSVNKNIPEFNGNVLKSGKMCTTQMEWELNQDIVDIAFKDITNSFSWIIPGFMRKFTLRIHQLSLLYLFTDVVYEEESPEWNELRDSQNYHTIFDTRKVFCTLQVFKDCSDSNCLSINNWLKKFYRRLRIFFRLEEEKKTYYLLGYFASQGYDHSNGNKNNMIRGPDRTKFNPAFSFHTRI